MPLGNRALFTPARLSIVRELLLVKHVLVLLEGSDGLAPLVTAFLGVDGELFQHNG